MNKLYIFLNSVFLGTLFLNFSTTTAFFKKKTARPTRIKKSSSKKKKHTSKSLLNHEQPATKPSSVAHKKIKSPFQTIRVLLHSWDHTRPVCIQSPKGFTVVDVSSKEKKIFSHEVTIEATPQGYKLNKLSFGSNIIIVPRSGEFTFTNNTYNGAARVTRDGQVNMLINMLDLEQYVCSVVRTESWPGWPLEVNKVFAIMCRTYAIAMMRQAQKGKKIFDIKNTNAHQTYRGIHDSLVIKEAARLTKGTFLTYENQPIVAMFDSCCGGVIPAHISSMNFSKTPYLARTYACTFCKRVPLYSWKAEYQRADFERMVGPAAGLEKKLSDIRITKKDKAGLVEELVLKSHNKSHSLAGKRLYSLLKEVRSYHFNAKMNGNKITLTGRGFGHHVGLCQWGAREMVRDGWNYKRILQFYYPKTVLAQLT